MKQQSLETDLHNMIIYNGANTTGKRQFILKMVLKEADGYRKIKNKL